MSLGAMDDSRPVNVGDLVAAQWYPDSIYYIGEVDYNHMIYNPGGVGSVDNAHHIVKLMDASEWLRLASDMGVAAFASVAQKFPMITTGGFSPEDTIKLEGSIKAAVLSWLRWNYPK